MNERKIIILRDENGMTRVALTQDQIRLLDWLCEHDWLYSEMNYQEEGEVETI